MATVTCPECGAELLAEDASRKFAVCPYCGAQVRINININYNFNYSKTEHTEHIIDEAKSKNADNVNRVIGIFATPFEEYRAQKDHERRMEEEEQRMADERIRRFEEQQRMDKEYARARQEERDKQWRARKQEVFRFCRKHPKETLISLAVCAVLFFGGIAAWSSHATKKQQELQHSAELARLEHEQITYSHLAQGEVQVPEIPGLKHDDRNLYLDDIDYRIAKRAFEDAGFTNVTAVATEKSIESYNNRVFEITVDGVPQVSTGKWYSIDTPIVISYYVYNGRSR